MTAAWLVTLAGCGAPISNEPFVDEAVFLGALPSTERLHAPSAVLLAPNGDADVLRAAKTAAAEWDTWWAIAAATGDELRAVPPDERTEVARRWNGLNVAARLTANTFGNAGAVIDWWVTAEVVEPAEGDPAWTIAIGTSEDGPFTAVGAGSGADGSGCVTWDLPGTAEALALDPPAPLGVLDATFTDLDPVLGVRRADLAYEVDGVVLPYAVAGEELLAFTGLLAVTDDGASWPGFATATHTATGGRAQGLVLEEGVERTFTSCWDANGLLVWQGGEGGVVDAGASEGACPIGPF